MVVYISLIHLAVLLEVKLTGAGINSDANTNPYTDYLC